MTRPSRLLFLALGTALVLVAGVFVREAARFGITPGATASRIEREVRTIVGERERDVEQLASSVAAEGRLVADANLAADARALPALFERLRVLAATHTDRRVAVTVYVPGLRPGDFSVLAWSDGPGEKNRAPTRLAGPPASFVAPGHTGLRLIRVEPIQLEGRRIAVAVAETVLADTDRLPRNGEPRLHTSFGPVRIVSQYASARDDGPGPDHAFTVTGRSEETLFEVQLDRNELDDIRQSSRRVGLAAALVPVPLAIALLTAGPLLWRRRARTLVRRLTWTLVALVILGAAVVGLVALAYLAGLPAGVHELVIACGLFAAVAVSAGYAWWQPVRRGNPADRIVRFTLEHLAAGVALALALELARRVLLASVSVESLGQGQSVLFPLALDRVPSFVALLIEQVAIGWVGAAALATASIRWRMPQGAAVAAVTLWLLPTIIGAGVSTASAPLAVAALLAAVFGMCARRARRFYRHTSTAFRLVMGFVSLVGPVLVLYPLSAAITDNAVRALVEDEYAPAVAGHPQELRRQLARAQEDVDRWQPLADLVSSPLPARVADDGATQSDSLPAFLVWSQTSLSLSRVTSAVELFGPDNNLISRFAFNLPEYVNRTAQQVRQGTGCDWDVFGEATPFGAEERLMLHAERGVCDAGGRVLGGIVVHVASNDYQALPFVASPSPYYDVVGDVAGASVRLPDIRLAVYGWSQRPIFTSGRVAWPLPQEVFDDLYATGQPRWRSLPDGDRTYAVRFSQNRVGVYAVGYPLPTVVDHASRLAEIVALFALLFITLQVGALAYAAVRRDRPAPLRLLLHEIRTSFYRKLFLGFVAVAVLPVVAASVAFGTYITARFQADVEREAAGTITVARRVLEELEAAGGPPNAATPPTDDALVWIRQVTGEDVNYFKGSELVATSQRDLFDSGLLPTRTPAAVFRGIALERRPTLVADDRVGDLAYLVAAAPVPSRGSDAILTVPLAPRQRELSAELDTLNRRVIVGAVLVVFFAAVLGASLAGRVADPVSRLTRATRQIAAGRLDVRIASESVDEFRTLVDDFNSMAATLVAQRTALARTNQLKAWNEMARQVAHEIKNPLTPVQLAAEHLQHVHDDRQRPLGDVLDQCVATILTQVRLLRRIASEFANFSSEPVPRPVAIDARELVESVVGPYRVGVSDRIRFVIDMPEGLPPMLADRTLVARALTNLVENAVQAVPSGGAITVSASRAGDTTLAIRVADTGPGMDAATLARAFEPFFSTKTAGSGLGLANARRAVEREGGTVAIASEPGAGTAVTMTLPLAADPHGVAGAAPPSR